MKDYLERKDDDGWHLAIVKYIGEAAKIRNIVREIVDKCHEETKLYKK